MRSVPPTAATACRRTRADPKPDKARPLVHRMTDTVFTTPRLNVRRWRPTDIDDLFGVYADAQAMRWVGDGRPITRNECEQWLQVTRANYARRGYGMFALELRDTGDGSRTQCFEWIARP